MKKALVYCLCLIFLLSFAACGENNGASSENESLQSSASDEASVYSQIQSNDSDAESTETSQTEVSSAVSESEADKESKVPDEISSTASKEETSSQQTPSNVSSSKPESNDAIKYFGETFTEGDDNFSATDLTTAYSSKDTSIKLNGNSVTVSGSGAHFADKRISITAAGTYVFSGTLSDGQIYVNVSKEEKVKLVFDGVNITNTTTACVYIDSCDKTVITLAEGSKNTLTDCKAYIFPSPSKTKPNSCIYSDDDLTINGSGSLTVNANYNNGIVTDNDLTIVGSTITVNAVNNAVKGDYSFTCKDANITIVTTGENGDGIKVEDDYRKDKGYVYIESGIFNITATDDAIQAVTSVTVLNAAKITTDCQGDVINCGENGIVSVPDGVITEK